MRSLFIWCFAWTFCLTANAVLAETVASPFDGLWNKSIEKILDLDGLLSFCDQELGIMTTWPS